MDIFCDGISNIYFANNTLRVTLVQSGPENSTREVGHLIVPLNQAPGMVNALTQALQQLDAQLKSPTGKEPTGD